MTDITDLKAHSIGIILSTKRKQLNIETAKISLDLKIKVKDIEAIESEKWSDVTHNLYVVGLIKSYAKILKIDENLIEEKIKDLPIESNIKNKKHQLVNIGENIDLTTDIDMFFNFLLISALLFFAFLTIYHSYENRSRVLTTKNLEERVEKILQN